MKRMFLFIAFFASLVLNLRAQDAFYIYRNDGEFNAFFNEEVDSITYSCWDLDSLLHDEYIVQEVYTTDSIYRIPLAAIDSVSFDVNDIVISPDFISFQGYDYEVVRYEDSSGEFVLHFISDSIPSFHESGLVVIETDSMMYLRRILSFEFQSTSVVLKTSQAYLNDVFLEGTFTLSTINSMVESKSITYYPYEVKSKNIYGDVHKIYDKDSSKDIDMYKQHIDYSDKTIWDRDWGEIGRARLYAEKCIYDFQLGLVITCNFKSAKDAYDKYKKGELAITKATLKGMASTDFMLRFDANGNWEMEVDTILKQNIHKPYWGVFSVNGVPVGVQVTTHLMLEGAFHAQAEFSANVGHFARAETEYGVSWSQNGGFTPMANYKADYVFYPPTIDGEAHFDEKMSIYPRINFAIYGLSGPSFDIKPYGKATADIGFYDNLWESQRQDYYGTEFKLDVGYDAAVGINFLPFWGSDLVFKSPSWNCVDINMHKTPFKITCIEEDGRKIRDGERIMATFHVEDYNFFKKECNTIFPLVVKFTTNSGIVEKDFAIVDTKTGNVSISWIPSRNLTSGTLPQLNAYLYNSTGQPILGDSWRTEFETHDIPVSIVKFEQTKASYWPGHYQNDGKDYSFMFNAKTYIKLTDDTNVKDWGYVYIDPDGNVSKKLSMKQYGRNSLIDPNVAYYRNEYVGTVKLQGYVEYEGDSQTYYGEIKEFPLEYPSDVSVEIDNCIFLGNETDVEYNGKKYKNKSSFGYTCGVVGAYWLTVRTKEEGTGWSNWNNDLPQGVFVPHDGENTVRINYHYGNKNFGGIYNVYLQGVDHEHSQTCQSNNYVTYTYDNNQFTGCKVSATGATMPSYVRGMDDDREGKEFFEAEINMCY